MASANSNLHTAKSSKKDEFYTQIIDIEKELQHYREHFAGKVVYCNCDDPRVSNFFHYFSHNFREFKLEKLLTTCYKNRNIELFSQNDSEQSIRLEYTGGAGNTPRREDIDKQHLQGDGDFRSPECIELLQEADIVVTNPPFSLFREYVAQLIEYDKKFVIIGNKNAITYKEIFQLIKQDSMWVGNTPMSTDMLFDVPKDFSEELIVSKKQGSGYKVVDGVVKARAQAIWFTNLDISKRHEDLILYQRYNPQEYPQYDNYNAINVDKTKEIPIDYPGAMGVPITFLDKYNPQQFTILGQTHSGDKSPEVEALRKDPTRRHRGVVHGEKKEKYARILIKNKGL